MPEFAFYIYLRIIYPYFFLYKMADFRGKEINFSNKIKFSQSIVWTIKKHFLPFNHVIQSLNIYNRFNRFER